MNALILINLMLGIAPKNRWKIRCTTQLPRAKVIENKFRRGLSSVPSLSAEICIDLNSFGPKGIQNPPGRIFLAVNQYQKEEIIHRRAARYFTSTEALNSSMLTTLTFGNATDFSIEKCESWVIR